MIINIHPNPDINNYDFHLPYCAFPRKSDLKKIKKNSETKIKSTTPKTFAMNVKRLIKKSKTVTLVNNGEPLARLEAARLALKNHLPEIKVKLIKNKNSVYKNNDPVFGKNSHIILTNTLITNNVDNLVEHYIKNFKKLKQNPKKVHERYHGYYKYGNMLWYQYGYHMPKTKDVLHKEIQSYFLPIYRDVRNIVRDFFIKNKIKMPNNLNDRLVLRMVHNTKQNNKKKKKFFKHIDNSLITGWLHEKTFGAKIYEFTSLEKSESKTKAISVKKLIGNSQNKIVMIPGSAWCDYLKNQTPATWHEVSFNKSLNQHRVSILFMVRAPEFEKTNFI